MINPTQAIEIVRKYVEEVGGVELEGSFDDFREIVRDDEIEFESEEQLLENFREFCLVD